jgi:putative ABC transport system permease protein
MRPGVIHKRFIFRQLTRSGGQPLLFIICVMLSIQGLVALDGFGNSVRRAMLQDARSLQAADIIIRSNAPFSSQLLSAVKVLTDRGAVQKVPVYEFYSMVRTQSTSTSLLAALKVVGPEYPFYGAVTLTSGKPFQDVLKSGGIIVEKNLLDRLNLRVGDLLAVGDRSLTILDVVVSEPDRPVNFLSFGPRVFVSLKDAESLHLMMPGSRVSYKLLLKVTDDEPPERLVKILEQSALEGQEFVDTFQTARSRIKEFFDNFFFFLTLIAIFTLLLAGFGIQSTLIAFIREKTHTIAVMKAIGGTSKDIRIIFFTLVFLLGMVGTVLGIASGLILEQLLPFILGPLFPATMEVSLSWHTVLKGLILGLLATVLFAIAPMERLKAISPVAIFRKDTTFLSKSALGYFSGFLLFGFFTGLILMEIKDINIGMRFLALLIGLILFALLFARAILNLLKRLHPRQPALRLALRGLFKPGATPISIITTLCVSLGFVFSMYLVEVNLDAAFIRAYPEDAPNLFFVNIQPDQKTSFARALEAPATFYPVIRARLVSSNNEKINRYEERKRKGDKLSRPFNLTYRDHLLGDESLLKGNTLFQKNKTRLQVSVLDTVVEMRSMKIGDTLKFKIQGVPVEAMVSSIRTRTRQSLKPFFYFVFPADANITSAPQTIFTALRLPKKKIPELQHRMISQFPNVSAIDVTQTLDAFNRIANRLVIIVRFFTAFSIVAGLLIIISSILATRWDRIQEAAFVKLVGAKSGFVFRVCAIEHLIIGLISALLALVISQSGSYLVCRYLFEIPYHPQLINSLFMIAATLIIVITVGILASIPVVRQKPITFLRNDTGG